MVPVQADSLTCDAGTPLPCTTHVPKALARSDIWFSDGNIVLVAGSAAFKVHRGQLERQSEVFRDLFSLPQPEDQNQTLVDGCPAIDLYDCPSDIYHLLVALYDGLHVFSCPLRCGRVDEISPPWITGTFQNTRRTTLLS